MREIDKGEPRPTIYNIFPIGREAAESFKNTFLPSLLDVRVAAAASAHYLRNLERAGQVELFDHIGRNIEIVSQGEYIRGLCYVFGVVSYLESARKEAERQGGVLPRITQQILSVNRNFYLSPEKYRNLAERLAQLKALSQEAIARGQQEEILKLLNEFSIDSMVAAVNVIEKKEVGRRVRRLAKDEPFLVKTLQNAGMEERVKRQGSGMIGLFRQGIVEARSIFEAAKLVHDQSKF